MNDVGADLTAIRALHHPVTTSWAWAPDERQTRCATCRQDDVWPCQATLAADLVELIQGQLGDVKRVSRRLRDYRGEFKQDAAIRADIADLIDAALDGTLENVMLP